MHITRYEEGILRSLRRITRAIDLYSRQLSEQAGLTGPQLICLRILSQHGEMQPTRLAREMALSPATITGIVDRLTARKMITRVRSKKDRRVVELAITPAGKQALERAPSLLQDRFARRLTELPEENQLLIHTLLEQIVKMMDAEELEVAPLLTTRPAGAPLEKVRELLSTKSGPGTSTGTSTGGASNA